MVDFKRLKRVQQSQFLHFDRIYLKLLCILSCICRTLKTVRRAISFVNIQTLSSRTDLNNYLEVTFASAFSSRSRREVSGGSSLSTRYKFDNNQYVPGDVKVRWYIAYINHLERFYSGL